MSLLFGESVYFHSLVHQNSHKHLPLGRVNFWNQGKALELCALCSNAFIRAIA
ncbi:hypothetical protein H6G35_22135 [Aulosira sp. FACHB-113]|nr:hypothetical protein [Aulosira sp. FACHB-113]